MERVYHFLLELVKQISLNVCAQNQSRKPSMCENETYAMVRMLMKTKHFLQSYHQLADTTEVNKAD